MTVQVFEVSTRGQDGEHRWALVQCSCDPSNADDALVRHTVALVRDAYGENEVLRLAEMEPDASVEELFDLAAVRLAIRLGLPDPDAEGKKPEHLTNYRSEAVKS